jgi:hypothetical protein
MEKQQYAYLGTLSLVGSSNNNNNKSYIFPKERSKSVTDPLIIPHPSRLSSAELPVLGGPKRSLLIDGANPYHFRSIQCFAFFICFDKYFKKRIICLI